MKFTSLLTAGALMTAMVSPVALAAAADTNTSNLSDTQTKQIEKLVHDYLVNNPEVLLEASQALQQKQQQTMQVQAQAAIQTNADQIFNDSLSVAGNPKGNVTLVEFFDYQCSHCKTMEPVINGLIKQNPNLRVVYKEFPIFGNSSELASKAALAAAMQGKYTAMHSALFKQEGRLNEDLIMKAAKEAGLDLTKFKADMNSKVVDEALDQNRQLAEKLHLMGTPAFIVVGTPQGKMKQGSTPTFIPGAASEKTLDELVKKEGSNS
ncbi:MAG: DsbA family protein [Tatlockia sp.]|nr:DsbA family protein [Tatlockia sp.]